MADTVTEVTKIGYGSRIMSSIKGIVFSTILFFGSFALLYWNEGRIDRSTILKQATPIAATASDLIAVPEGAFVSAAGGLSTPTLLGDGRFLVPGPYVRVERIPEMYAWIEETDTKTQKNVGGSETQTKTTTYKRDWTPNPPDSGKFKEVAGHENLPLDLSLRGSALSSDAQVGEIKVNLAKAELRAGEDLILDDSMLALTPEVIRAGNFLFMGKGTIGAPQIGDVRIRYRVVRTGMDVTVFGAKTGSTITPFVDEKTGEQMYLIYPGTKAEATKALRDEYTTWMWIWRAVGFFMMWSGLGGMLSVVNVLLDVLPFLGSISRALLGLITFVIALVLSTVTIVVSMVLHSIVALVIVAVLVAAGGYWLWQKRKKPGVVGPSAP